MNIFEDEAVAFLKCLNDANVSFILVGGLAVNYHGFTRATGDLDIWVKDEPMNRVKFVKALTEFGIVGAEVFLKAPLLPGFTEILLDNGEYVDIMSELQFFKTENFDACYGEANLWSPEKNVSIRVLHLNTLIEEKEKSSRPKDQEDARVLKELRSFL